MARQVRVSLLIGGIMDSNNKYTVDNGLNWTDPEYYSEILYWSKSADCWILVRSGNHASICPGIVTENLTPAQAQTWFETVFYAKK